MILFYTTIILIVRVDGFFIPCETNIDCEDLDEFENYHCINELCINTYFTTSSPSTTTWPSIATTISPWSISGAVTVTSSAISTTDKSANFVFKK